MAWVDLFPNKALQPKNRHFIGGNFQLMNHTSP